MAKIMLNGKDYSAPTVSTGGSGSGDYARKPLVLYDGSLTSGSQTFDLFDKMEYVYTGFDRVFTCGYHTGTVGSQFIKLRVTGSYNNYRIFNREVCLTGPAVGLTCLFCAQSSIPNVCFTVCNSYFGYTSNIYPDDGNDNKITSYGYIVASLYQEPCPANNPSLEISLISPVDLKLHKIELL